MCVVNEKEITRSFLDSYTALLNSFGKSIDEIDWLLTHGIVTKMIDGDGVVCDYTSFTKPYVFVKDV